MRMRRLAWGAAIALVLSGCRAEPTAHGPEERLAVAVEQAGQAGKPLKLADATDFPWDRVHIFSPYVATADIERALGFRWPEAAATGIQERDDVALLVFVQGKRVVRTLRPARNRGDWAMIENHAGFTPAKAVFHVTRDEGDPPWWNVTEPRP
ncbi:MAG: hypothetical protein ACK46X_06870 [Candidatus Sericytochromatia bacterium]